MAIKGMAKKVGAQTAFKDNAISAANSATAPSGVARVREAEVEK